MNYKRKYKSVAYLGPRAEAQRRRDVVHIKDAESRRECLRDLHRCDKQLAKVTREIQRQKRIKPRKPTRAQQERLYRRLRDEWLVGKLCQCCIVPTPATDCHHWAGRTGRLLLYVPFWKPLCAEHHAAVHRSPVRAHQLGLLAPVGLWNEQRQVPKDYVPTI